MLLSRMNTGIQSYQYQKAVLTQYTCTLSKRDGRHLCALSSTGNTCMCNFTTDEHLPYYFDDFKIQKP